MARTSNGLLRRLRYRWPRASTPLEHWGVAGRAPKTRESRRRRRRGVGSVEGLCPFPENLWSFLLKMAWYMVHSGCVVFMIHVFNCWIKNYTLDALQMKMTATCGIQKFRWREKIKHLSKYWGVVNTRRPLQACRSNVGGHDPCNPCGVDIYAGGGVLRSACLSVCLFVCLSAASP